MQKNCNVFVFYHSAFKALGVYLNRKMALGILRCPKAIKYNRFLPTVNSIGKHNGYTGRRSKGFFVIHNFLFCRYTRNRSCVPPAFGPRFAMFQ